MTSIEPVSQLAGCDLTPLESEAACTPYLNWLLGQGGVAPPADAAKLSWALAHCDDGVTWGRYDPNAQVWHLGSQVAPDVSPTIRRETLQELRLFGEHHEVLIWRAGSALRGRSLRESSAARPGHDDAADPLRPSNESRILRGTRVQALSEEFSHVSDAAGAQQVLPIAITEAELSGSRARLIVRHYYETDLSTGAVRVAATRIVYVTVLPGA